MNTYTSPPWRLEGPQFSGKATTCEHPGCTEHTREQMTGFAIWNDAHPSKWIADVHGEHLGVPREECEATARLFMAAPDLLEALRLAVRGMSNARRPEWDESETLGLCIAAIHKAEGKA